MRSTRRNLQGFAALGLAGAILAGASAQTTLVPSGATWRFRKGTSEASNPASQWRTTGFEDSSWSSSEAPFHYGDGLTTGTTLTDMRGNYTCVFLRLSFPATEVTAIQSLQLSVDYDDGFVAWINGIEVARSGVDGDPLFTDTASLSHEAGSPVTFTIPRAPSDVLQEGLNVLAIQAFNRSLSDSTDFRLDAALRATRADDAPPSILSHTPSDSSVGSLTEVTVVFSEAVVGVQATDLLLNDQPAAGVAGGASMDRYTFSFTQPPPGLVRVSWSEAGAITDLQGNLLDTEAPGASWSYQLLDTAAPVIARQTPPPGATVSRLEQVQLVFSESVRGVDASDLLINAVPAVGVVGSEPDTYIFWFPSPASGQVQFSWAPSHGIVDASPAANAFGGVAWSLSLDPGLEAGDIVLSEVVAAAYRGLVDEDGEAQDWIELHNRGLGPVDLLGWSLTDEVDQPGKWIFPSRILDPGEYLVVFASGKDRRAPTGSNRFHTNFKLNAFGEYVALGNAESPPVVVAEFAPEYPEQRQGYSYGLDAAGDWRYFEAPTPGQPNGASGIVGVAPPPHFSVERGVFDRPFNLLLTTALPDATIRYTTDGSEPTALSGSVYFRPILVNRTTTLRAVTFRDGYLPSRVQTASYLFLEDVIQQPNDPAGFPSTWGTRSGFPNGLVPADYEMDLDPLRTNPNDPSSPVDPEKLERLRAGLRELPIVSIVLDQDDMFGPGGLYPTSSDASKAPNEKACSLEMFLPDGSTAFVIDGGLDLHGNASRNPLKNPKHGFKLTFKKDYGPTTLDYRLFPDSPAEVFDDLILRPDFNSSWRHWSDVAGNGAGAFQRSRGTRTRYAWSQETFRAMGNVSSHTLYFHLFINGLYWGTYDFGEQPTDKFAEAYYGGEALDYDVYDQGALRLGSSTAYNAMRSLDNLVDNENYERMKQYLDVPQFIDYMLLHFYVGHQDWGNTKNWYAVRPRVEGPAGTFKYLPWDQECILLEENVNRVPNGGGNTDVPSGLHTKLDDNAQYRLDFADRVYQHMLAPSGALTPEANIARWQQWQALLDHPIVAESCRWGDYRRDVHPYSEGAYQLYTREDHWLTENRRMVDSYFINRGGIVLGQLRTAGLYPAVEPPHFNQQGGRVPMGFEFTLSAGTGTIYYTTNGVDPRVYGSGTVSPHAMVYHAPVALSRSATVKARLLDGGTWSALNEVRFIVEALGVPLRITEIMYHPPANEAYEFIEIQNVGFLPLDIGGYSMRGVDFIFPDNSVIAPGATLVLGSSTDPTAFSERYPSAAVFGVFSGNLNNGGERLAIVDRAGQTVTAVHYDDEGGWPVQADGGGYSLEIVDPRGDPNGLDNWRASTSAWGNPGLGSGETALGDVVLNEVMADNVSAVPHEGLYPDWVELHNRGSNTVDLANWSLTDTSAARRFLFPEGAALAPGAFRVVWCDDSTNASGLHTGFALGRKGDTVFLDDANTNRVDAISFGLQVPDLAVGRVDDRWRLTEPTPGQANRAASLAASIDLVLNEWLANPAPGERDWLELFNPSLEAPVSLQGLWLGTSQALDQAHALSFVAAGGFACLYADEESGADHLEFRLSATGGSIVLYDATGLELDRVQYGPQTLAVSEGRLPDGAGAIVAFPGSASPAASNYLATYQGPFIHEVLSRNQRAVVSPWGTMADWIEFHNPAATAADLGGMALAPDESSSERWVFPVGTIVPGDQYLVVWCDGSRAGSTQAQTDLNTGFSLGGASGEVVLFNTAGQIVDAVRYGFQIADYSIGRGASGWELLAAPSPGTANAAPAELGPVTALRINEWMANPLAGDDWFEIYNLDPRPVDLGGLYLTDDPSSAGLTKTQVAPLSFVEGGGWVKWVADDDLAKGRDHVAFRLDERGESLRLSTADLTPVDIVDFGLQASGVSQGRLVDGDDTVVEFPDTPTPGTSNYRSLPSVVINEVLSHTDPPLEDAVELYNLTQTAMDIGGWYLSDSARDLKRYRIPDNTRIDAGGYRVFYQVQFGPLDGDEDAPPLFSFNSAHGDTVILSEADSLGILTGYRAQATFGAAANGVSFGRHPTSVGVDFVALSARTFGMDNPATRAEFRTGNGQANAYPEIGPIVLNEIMYQPALGTSGEPVDPAGEFIELFNPTAQDVPLADPAHPTNSWRLANAVSFHFAPDTVIPSGEHLLVVPFDPVLDADALTTFRNDYGTEAAIVGPYVGRLGNDGESVELHRPDNPQSGPSSDAGFVPYLLVDRVDYSPRSPWPTNAAGDGSSLQRRQPADYGNDPVNWIAAYPTPGRSASPGDRDNDGLPDDWELEYGTNPDAPDDAADPDQDGMTNYDEYVAGTDPKQFESALILSLTSIEPDRVTFEFQAAADRTYRLFYRDELGAGQWIKLGDDVAAGAGRRVTLSDPAPAPRERFYRLVTPAEP